MHDISFGSYVHKSQTREAETGSGSSKSSVLSALHPFPTGAVLFGEGSLTDSLHVFIHGFIRQIFIERSLYAKHGGEWCDCTLPRTLRPAEDGSPMLGKLINGQVGR